jgi:hypothetical protein
MLESLFTVKGKIPSFFSQSSGMSDMSSIPTMFLFPEKTVNAKKGKGSRSLVGGLVAQQMNAEERPREADPSSLQAWTGGTDPCGGNLCGMPVNLTC